MTQQTPGVPNPDDGQVPLPPQPGDSPMTPHPPSSPQQYPLDTPPGPPTPPANVPMFEPMHSGQMSPGQPIVPMGPPPRRSSAKGLLIGGLVAVGLVVVLVVVLLGLNGGGGDGSPTGVAERALLALEREDVDAFIDLVCAEQQDEMESERADIEAALAAFAGMLAESDWQVTDERIEGDTAWVRVEGADAIFGGNGEETRLIKEDGAWKICEE